MVVSACFLFTPWRFLGAGAVTGFGSVSPPVFAGDESIAGGGELAEFRGEAVSATFAAFSLVLLVIDMDLTGRVDAGVEVLCPVERGFFPNLSFGGGTVTETAISTSSLGIVAILVRKSFSRVWAMTTISSPALL